MLGETVHNLPLPGFAPQVTSLYPSSSKFVPRPHPSSPFAIFETTFEKPPLDEQEVLRKTKRQGRSSWGVRRAARPVWFKRSAGIRTRVQSGAARMKRFHHTAGK